MAVYFHLCVRTPKVLVILLGVALVTAFQITVFSQHRLPNLIGANSLLTLDDANDPRLSFNGKRMVVLPEVGVVEAYEVMSRQKMRVFKAPNAGEAWISSNGRQVAISGMIPHFTDGNHYIPESKLWIYDIESGDELAQIDTYVEINGVKTRNLGFGDIYGFLSGDLHLAASSLRGDQEQQLANGGVWVWDIETKKLIGSFGEYVKYDSWKQVKITPDGRFLAAANWGVWKNNRRGTFVWDIQQRREMLRFPFYCSLALSDNGGRLATNHSKPDETEITEVWNITTAKRISEIKIADLPRIGNFALSPDGIILATANDNFVLFWDTDSGRLLGVQQFASTRDEDAVGRIVFSGNGKVLAVEGQGEDIKVYLLNDILKSAAESLKEYRKALNRRRRA